MNLNNFTIKSQEVIQSAQQLTQQLGHQQIENEHLFKALMEADDNVEIISMADVFSDRIEKSLKGIREHFGNKKKINLKQKNIFVGFDSYKKAIDLCDVVILATPPGFRPLHFEYAIDNGKHVFMEKPLATDATGVRRVLKSAQKAK